MDYLTSSQITPPAHERFQVWSGEVTVATAFPFPFAPPAETVRRARGWIAAQGWDGTAYDARATALGASDQHCHTLFTRTLTAHGHWATLYLRPPLNARAASSV